MEKRFNPSKLGDIASVVMDKCGMPIIGAFAYAVIFFVIGALCSIFLPENHPVIVGIQVFACVLLAPSILISGIGFIGLLTFNAYDSGYKSAVNDLTWEEQRQLPGRYGLMTAALIIATVYCGWWLGLIKEWGVLYFLGTAGIWSIVGRTQGRFDYADVLQKQREVQREKDREEKELQERIQEAERKRLRSERIPLIRERLEKLRLQAVEKREQEQNTGD